MINWLLRYFNRRARCELGWAHYDGAPMPSKTPKQAKTMRAAAHNPKFAKKVVSNAR